LPPPLPAPDKQSSAAPPAGEATVAATQDSRAPEDEDRPYPNLAQVPARPLNMPTFAQAAATEKQLLADRANAKDRPDSPSPDQVLAPRPTPAVGAAANAVDFRLEDRSPCLAQAEPKGEPAATIQFAPGSASLTADNMETLAGVLPAVRSSTGTIRILGHGDTDTGAAKSSARFDLAVTRADSVADALTGYGIPACVDSSFAGQSVQLFTES
jgi:outer membrane protein OmpA-like peptidoglycan-associated protein